MAQPSQAPQEILIKTLPKSKKRSIEILSKSIVKELETQGYEAADVIRLANALLRKAILEPNITPKSPLFSTKKPTIN